MFFDFALVLFRHHVCAMLIKSDLMAIIGTVEHRDNSLFRMRANNTCQANSSPCCGHQPSLGSMGGKYRSVSGYIGIMIGYLHYICVYEVKYGRAGAQNRG